MQDARWLRFHLRRPRDVPHLGLSIRQFDDPRYRFNWWITTAIITRIAWTSRSRVVLFLSQLLDCPWHFRWFQPAQPFVNNHFRTPGSCPRVVWRTSFSALDYACYLLRLRDFHDYVMMCRGESGPSKRPRVARTKKRVINGALQIAKCVNFNTRKSLEKLHVRSPFRTSLAASDRVTI